jgi:hypothetical protein
MSITEFYSSASTAVNAPYSETAISSAYNYIKTYSTIDPDITALISSGNLLASIGKTTRYNKEINAALNSALATIPHASRSYATSVMSAVKVSRDCVKQNCDAAAVSASLAAFYGSRDAGAYNAVQTAYKTSGLNSAFICGAGLIYMRVFTLITETHNPDTIKPSVHKFKEYLNDTDV